MAISFPSTVSLESIPFLWNFRLQPGNKMERPLKLPNNLNSNPENWEVHYFWPWDHQNILIPVFDAQMYDLHSYRYKLHEDLYLLNQDLNLNIKIRHQELLIKKQLASEDEISAFAKKAHYPLKLDKRAEQLTKESLEDLLLESYGPLKSDGTCYILKESMRIKLKKSFNVKIEFSKLYINKDIFLSLSIESNKFKNVKYYKDQLNFTTSPITYTTFINKVSNQ